MKSTGANKESGSAHLFVVTSAVVVLVGLMAVLYWNNITNSDSQTVPNNEVDNSKVIDDAVYNKPDNWLTYEGEDIPYVFDYPDMYHLEKSVSSYGEGGSAGEHVTTTIQLLTEHNDRVANLRHETGIKFLNNGTPCRTGKSVTVTSNIFFSSKVQVCDENGNKYWTVSDENSLGNGSRTLLHLFAKGESSGGLDLSTFSKIIKSINRKNLTP